MRQEEGVQVNLPNIQEWQDCFSDIDELISYHNYRAAAYFYFYTLEKTKFNPPLPKRINVDASINLFFSLRQWKVLTDFSEGYFLIVNCK